jgi:hypothetical protein
MFRVKEAVVRLGRCGLDLTEHKKLRYQDATPYGRKYAKAFFTAVKDMNFGEIEKLLEMDKWLLFCRDYLLRTAVMIAAEMGSTKMLKFLKARKGDFYAIDDR